MPIEQVQSQTITRKGTRYQINAGLQGSDGIQSVMDISQGGVKLACSIELAAGALIDLSFKLPNGNKIEAQVKVCWSKKAEKGTGFQSGCEFSRIAPNEARLLKNYFLCLSELNKSAKSRDHCSD